MLKQIILVLFLGLFFFVKPSQAVVALQDTPVKDQGSEGFCWSYGLMGLAEQVHAQKSGEILNLSEEYVGLAHMIEQVALGATGDQIYAGGFPALALDYLIPKYGVLPQAVFPRKFFGEKEGIESKIRKAVDRFKTQNHLSKNEKISGSDATKIVARAADVKSDFFDPYFEFNFQGKTYTPRRFLRERVHFNPKDFVTVLFPNPIDSPESWRNLEKMIQATLISGFSIPMAFYIFSGSSAVSKAGEPLETSLGVFDYDGVAEAKPVGGHVVLLTDFKTKSSQFGRSTKEVAKTASQEEIQALSIKNSWGLGSRANVATLREGFTENGIPSRLVMTSSYLRKSATLTTPMLPANTKKLIEKTGIYVLPTMTPQQFPFYFQYGTVWLSHVILPKVIVENGGQPISLEGIRPKPQEPKEQSIPLLDQPPFEVIKTFDPHRESASLADLMSIYFGEKGDYSIVAKSGTEGSIFGFDPQSKPRQQLCLRLRVNPKIAIDHVVLQFRENKRPVFAVSPESDSETKCIWFSESWFSDGETTRYLDLELQARQGPHDLGPSVPLRIRMLQ